MMARIRVKYVAIWRLGEQSHVDETNMAFRTVATCLLEHLNV